MAESAAFERGSAQVAPAFKLIATLLRDSVVIAVRGRPTSHDRNLVATARNERLSEPGGDHPVPYSDDLDGIAL